MLKGVNCMKRITILEEDGIMSTQNGPAIELRLVLKFEDQ